MSRTSKNPRGDYRITIRAARRKQPDVAKFARAVINLALQQAALEADAQQSVPRPDPSAVAVEGHGEVDA